MYREQGFRSSLIQQGEQNIQKAQELRIMEQNSINASISNMIRQQETDLLKVQNQERLQQATDSLIQHQRAQEEEARSRTTLAQEVEARQQGELLRKEEARRRADASVDEFLRAMGGGGSVGGAATGSATPQYADPQTSLPVGIARPDAFAPSEGSRLPVGIRGEDAPAPASIAELATGLNDPRRFMPDLNRLPPVRTVTGVNERQGGHPTTADIPAYVPGDPSAGPDPSLFQFGEGGEVTEQDIVAASNLMRANEAVTMQEVGKRGVEVVLKTPGVDPGAAAKAAVAGVNEAGATPRAVPSPEFIAYPETVEQQQMNQQVINKRFIELKQYEGVSEIAKEGTGAGRGIIAMNIHRLQGEIEAMRSSNTLTGVVDLTPEDFDLITDYNAELARNPDFVEFRNTKNDTIVRRDQFITKIAAKGKGAIAKLMDINSKDLAEKVKEAIAKGEAGDTNKPLRSPPRDATMGSRGNPGPVAPTKVMGAIDEMLQRNQRQ